MKQRHQMPALQEGALPGRRLYPRQKDWYALLPLCLSALALAIWHRLPCLLANTTSDTSRDIVETLASSSDNTVLECFQVAQPIMVAGNHISQPDSCQPNGRYSEHTGCSVPLMDHVFAWSYGQPYVGDYTPPECDFDRVIVNLTVQSEGRQFDRLALMFLNDTEVWRTSTAEPVKPPGIRWTVLKDMSHFRYLWKSPQKLIFDLGNLINDKYTGTFNATLTASFYQTAGSRGRTAFPADLILPISANRGSLGFPSHFDLPRDEASESIILPRNVYRAIVTISANGQAAEEFWWSNVLETDKATFARTTGTFPGLSPFREVQLLIDGRLAGVSWPFPVIFTGGVTPSLHRPVVGLQAFDLRENQIDITPWLPLLCDGHEHTFAFRVVGIYDDGRQGGVLNDDISASWHITGKIFLWLDEDSASVTTGTIPSAPNNLYPGQGLAISLSRAIRTNDTGFNETLSFELTVRRELDIHATVITQHHHSHVRWTQSLEYANFALVDDYGSTQVNDFKIKGLDTSTGSDRDQHFEVAYEYLLNCNQSIKVSDAGDTTIQSTLLEGFQLKTRGNSVLPIGTEGYDDVTAGGGSTLQTLREGSGYFFAPADKRSSSGLGSTQQLFYFGELLSQPGQRVDISRELYFRNVTAVNGSIVDDHERCTATACGKRRHSPTHQAFDNGHNDNAGNSGSSGGGGGTQCQPLSWLEYAEPRAAGRYFAAPQPMVFGDIAYV